jgi:hypothetical protein
VAGALNRARRSADVHLMTELAQQQSELANSPTAEPREPDRRRVRLLVAASAVAVLALVISIVISTTGGSSGHGPAAFAFASLPDGKVSVRVVNSDVSADQMTRQLQDAGLNITINAVPANAQLVGRWLAIESSEDVPAETLDDLVDQTVGKIAALEVTKTFPGHVTLTVGRAPRRGEELQVVGIANAAAPGGALYCQKLSGTDAAVAGAKLVAAGYTVRFRPTASSRTVTEAPARTKVVQAHIYDDIAPRGGVIDPRAVELVVRPPDHPYFNQLRWTGYPGSVAASGKPDHSDC